MAENRCAKQSKYIEEGVTYKGSNGVEYQLKNVKSSDPAKWKKKKKSISMIVSLSVMILLVATFLLQCTTISPWVYSENEIKEIAIQEMNKRYDKDFVVTGFGPASFMGDGFDKIGIKVKNSTDDKSYMIHGTESNGKYIIKDNYFVENIKGDYEAVIREILDKEIGEYKLNRLDFRGYNNYVDYCTKDTRLKDIYDLGLKHAYKDENGSWIIGPIVVISLPAKFASEHDMREVITAIMTDLAKRKVVSTWTFNIINDEAYSKKTGSYPISADDIINYYLTGILNDLSIDEIEKY